jgi:hypothetical protein
MRVLCFVYPRQYFAVVRHCWGVCRWCISCNQVMASDSGAVVGVWNGLHVRVVSWHAVLLLNRICLVKETWV